MALIQDTVILKEDPSSNTGIADQLIAEDSTATSYLLGNKFNGLNSSAAYYDESNIVRIFQNSVYISNLAGSDICKDKTVQLTIEQIKRTVSESKIANFDDLSAMVVNAFLPLTNIRYSQFRYMRHDGDDYFLDDIYGNVYLKDDSILGTAQKKIARNVNNGQDGKIESNFIVNDRNYFVNYGNVPIGEDLKNIKTSLVRNEYIANQNAIDSIVVSTVDEIINLCLAQVNRIRNGLSCYFEDDYNSPANQLSVTYWKANDDSSNIKKVLIRYKYYLDTIISWPNESNWALNESVRFGGWSTQKRKSSAADVEWNPGDKILLTENQMFYPVLIPRNWVQYRDDQYPKIVKGNKHKLYFDETDTYKTQGIFDYNVNPPNGRLKYYDKLASDIYKDNNLHAGYAISQGSSSIMPIVSNLRMNRNYELWPKFNPYEIKLIFSKGTSWDSGKHTGGTKTTKGKTYPVKVNLGVNVRDFNTIKVTFTGWVNERYHTHPCSIYCDLAIGSKEILHKFYICSYGGNSWSWHRSPTIPYAQWPKTSTGNINIKNVSGQYLYAYFYAIDKFSDKEPNASNGEMYVSEVKLSQ